MNVLQPRGVGTELKRLLSWWGIDESKSCKCKRYAHKMNVKGFQWCMDHRKIILGWLRKSAKELEVCFIETIANGFLGMAIKRAETMANLEKTFDAVYCINLDRRKDRWEDFQKSLPEDWPFGNVRRIAAIDARNIVTPEWWHQGAPAWGCYRSHLRLIEEALNTGKNSILLLEDDATFCEGFTEKVGQYIEALPENWGLVYFGGQHLHVNRHPPIEINPLVYRPWNVNRTHAFAIRGKKMLKTVYQHLNTHDWHKGNHIDHHLGRLVQRREDPIYTPHKWLVGQAEGVSNIGGGDVKPERYWPAASVIAEVDPTSLPFIAVLGLHSSGSSCMAGVLYHLGFYLGKELIGYYGNNPQGDCGFEAVGLAGICEAAIPFPATESKWKRGKKWNRLKGFLNSKRREAYNLSTVAAGKYPQLCQFGKQLVNLCGEHLYIVAIDRPIRDSIRSLQKRDSKKDPDQLTAHQRWLDDGKEWTIGQVDLKRVLRIDYYDLLADPVRVCERVREFCLPMKLEFLKDDQLFLEGTRRVEKWVDPKKRHIGRPTNGASIHYEGKVKEETEHHRSIDRKVTTGIT